MRSRSVVLFLSAAVLSTSIAPAECAAEEPPKPKAAAAPREKKPVWPVIVLGAASGAGLVVSIAGFVVSVQRTADAEGVIEELRDAGQTCASLPARCEAAQASFDEEVGFRAMGITGLVVGVAALTALAFYQIVPAGPGPKVSVVPLGAGAALRVEL